MRTLRLSLVGTVMSVLFAVSVGGALAQTDEEQPDRSGPLAVAVEMVDTDAWVFEPGHPYGTMYDWEMVIDADATDPRFSGTWTLVQNMHGLGGLEGPDTFIVSTGTALLESENGTWVGEVLNFSSAPHESLSLVVEGAGAYEGFGAILHLADREWNEFRGVVFEGGLPPLPDPVEAPAE